ncbi:MAG TPA: ATP-binding protein [Verrucomicrobiae bacterium]|nr:ATP-binding protein [Verrucomicrobiae bacterium]
MKTSPWQWLKRLPAVLAPLRPEPGQHAQSVVKLQRNIILPTRLLVVSMVLYHLYTSPWLGNVVNSYGVLFETIEKTFTAYALFVVGVTAIFYVVRPFPAGSVQWLAFAVGLADGVFLGGLTVLTGGFESVLYWVYPALIVLNAISIPLATPQLALNLLLGIFFLSAGLLDFQSEPELSTPSLLSRSSRIQSNEIKDVAALANWLSQAPEPARKYVWDGLPENIRSLASNHVARGGSEEELQASLAKEMNRIFRPPRYVSDLPSDLPEVSIGPYVLRVVVLVLLAFCCYGVQVLFAGQLRNEEEQKEYAVRTEQLRSAGRLAAEVAHQIKNPLAIINNVTFSLQKNFVKEKPEAAAQIEIIREEIAKADRIITEVMGYAQLSEGRVQKLNVIDEINRAIEEVFPANLPTNPRIHREFGDTLPPLLMQKKHFGETIGNLLQNARDAVNGRGNIHVGARFHANQSVEITVRDDGPGVPPDRVERIFEAYYTTKAKGTGLGLSVVKHNAELYGGRVRVESELGKGAKFTLIFPAKALMQTSS